VNSEDDALAVLLVPLVVVVDDETEGERRPRR